MHLRVFLPVVACAGWLVGCRSSQPIIVENYAQANKLVPDYVRQYSVRRSARPWLGAPPGGAVRLRRRNPASPVILRGHVDRLLENGLLQPQPGATIMAGGLTIFSDEAGNYTLPLPVGQQPVRAGGVGFLWSQAAPLQVAAGDSICLNFRLLQDPRPILCQ